jgi:hypothetical protein
LVLESARVGVPDLSIEGSRHDSVAKKAETRVLVALPTSQVREERQCGLGAGILIENRLGLDPCLLRSAGKVLEARQEHPRRRILGKGMGRRSRCIGGPWIGCGCKEVGA